MKRYKLYLFDFDGTLFDSHYSLEDVFYGAFKAIGVTIDKKETPRYARQPLPDTCREVNAPDDPESIRIFIAEIRRLLDDKDILKKTKIFPETMEVLNYFNAFARQGVEIHGQGGDEGFTLTGGHLGDLALMQDGAADELHVVVAHVPRNHVTAGGPSVLVDGLVALDGDALAAGGEVTVVLVGGHHHRFVILETAGGLLHYGEGLRKDLVQHLLCAVVGVLLQFLHLLVKLLLLRDGHPVVGVERVLDLGDAGFVVLYGLVDELFELIGLRTQFVIGKILNGFVCLENEVFDGN